MTRRITLALVATVAAALVLVGFGTLAIASLRARTTTENDLRRQVDDVADRLQQLASAPPDAEESPLTADEILRRRLRSARVVSRVISLDDLSVVTYGRQEAIQGELPSVLAGETIDVLQVPDRLTTVVSRRQLIVVARAVRITPRLTAVVIGARRPSTGTGAAARWFLVAGMATIGLAAIVALRLAKRLSRPVREASAAAQQIAAGQLAVRLAPPEPGRHDELSELTNSINTLAANLERSRAVEQQFLLSVSHDLRTPLTSIRGYAEALVDGRGEPARAGAVMLGEARRLERLVGDLLDLAKLQARSFSLQAEPVDLVRLAADVADGARPDATERGVAVVVRSAVPATVRADPDRLAQVVANLVENAVKFARTRVEVAVEPGALFVDDDGPGIPDDDLPHVFERLYVARHALERRESGSGLGLAIVKELIEAMGGTVSAGASPLGGARLSVRLPA